MPYIFFLISLVLFSSFAISDPGKKCEDIFGSKLYYENQVISTVQKSKEFHPLYTDPVKERALVKHWNEEPVTPPLLKVLFPEGVYFIKNQQFKTESVSSVKMGEPGVSLIVRADYVYQHKYQKDGKKQTMNYPLSTNVVFSKRALFSNFLHQKGKNWLVGQDAKAAILFLHGGGTNASGAHVGSPIVSHFYRYNVDVVSIDLPWHNQGHREFFDFETEIKVLGSFVQKYIPPHVPLFVWGHSYGSVFAEKLMQMTERPKKEFHFHDNLKGVLIMSSAVDAAPGKPFKEKYSAYEKKMKLAMKNQESAAPAEENLWKTIVADGKTNPLGAYTAMKNILQLDQSLPKHKGDKWIPGLMLVGKGDPLVYLGFEDNYEVYKSMKNIEYHYLEELLYYPDQSVQKVGHLLSDYYIDGTKKPVNLGLAHQFIEKQLKTIAVISVQGFIINKIKLSSVVLPDKKKSLEEKVWSLSSFEQLNEFVEDLNKNQTLETTTIDEIQSFINKQVVNSSLEMSSMPQNMSHFIDIVQYFANNLAFRHFLKDYRMYHELKTKNFQHFVKRRNEVSSEISDLLYIYTNPLFRIFHFLDTALKAKNSEEWESLKSEWEHLVDKDFLSKSLFNKDITQKLESWKESDPFSSYSPSVVNPFKKYLLELKEYMEQKQSRALATMNNRRKTPSAVNQILSYSIKEAMRVIHSYRLPPKVYDQLKLLLKEYFIVRSIVVNSVYLPELADLMALNVFKEKKNRIQFIHKALDSTVQTIKENKIKLEELHKKEKELKDEFNKLNSLVRAHLKTIKLALEEVVTEQPLSLKEDYQKSIDKFETVLSAKLKMEQALDDIALRVLLKKDNLSSEEITNLLQKNKPVIDQFSDLFLEYVKDRKIISKKAISSMEKGEMGEKPQKAVIDIYGVNSQGDRPGLGVKSIYLQLENVIMELADLEHQKIVLSRVVTESKMEYLKEMNTLVQLISDESQNNGNDSNNTVALLSQVAYIIEMINDPIRDVLSGSRLPGEVDLTKPLDPEKREQVFNYITHRAEPIFKEAIKKWNASKSTHPPPLPTE